MRVRERPYISLAFPWHRFRGAGGNGNGVYTHPHPRKCMYTLPAMVGRSSTIVVPCRACVSITLQLRCAGVTVALRACDKYCDTATLAVAAGVLPETILHYIIAINQRKHPT